MRHPCLFQRNIKAWNNKNVIMLTRQKKWSKVVRVWTLRRLVGVMGTRLLEKKENRVEEHMVGSLPQVPSILTVNAKGLMKCTHSGSPTWVLFLYKMSGRMGRGRWGKWPIRNLNTVYNSQPIGRFLPTLIIILVTSWYLTSPLSCGDIFQARV